ncbi:MAG: Trk family potassium uptake protein [Lachnospiraceae bacterium]|nr:Trk family potassium uptake protein [Lachnospiraceae bacterium]
MFYLFTKKIVSDFQIIILAFACVILLGGILLMLPVSSAAGLWTPFSEALFTSTSAVCVTGLVVHDTMTYWSIFGKTVILLLIQTGGMGVVTLSAMVLSVTGHKLGLVQRTLIQDSIGSEHMGGLVHMVRFIVKVMLIVEGIGACILATVFIPMYGPVKGAAFSVFHSVSAFCNAGFDLMGEQGEYSSLTGFAANPVVTLTISLLIILGGIGFFSWKDFMDHGLKFRRYRMQTKAILVMTAALLLLPAIYLFVAEYGNLPLGERLLAAIFQAVTPRTAGFNTTDLTQMSGTGQAVTVILMLIGGAPGSTAGGMKVTTIFVILATCASVFGGEEECSGFGRSIDNKVISQAMALMTIYMILFLVSGAVICSLEQQPLHICLFEAASAIGTVGLTLGITPSLGLISKIILIALMFLGRTGGLTIAWALFRIQGPAVNRKYPKGNIAVG